MDTVKITLAIYARVLERSSALTLRNWPVLATVFVYLAILDLTLPIALALGMLGGFLVSLARAACAASFLYLVERIVRSSKVSVDDFLHSFGVYLWDVVGVLFVVWIFQAVAVPALLQSPSGLAIVVSLELVAFVFFNAVPELVYLGHHSALELFSESARFISENWIEWFPPNLLAAAGFAVLLALPLPGGVLGSLLRSAVLALYVYFAMVMRGLLFQELYGSSRRSRLFRWKASR
ncbi:MAG: hypothetical protein HYY35_06135 [Deltaproteobacteria bacterium]|nr:hypothetical protein [Deltaproteobacteria bacterium]